MTKKKDIKQIFENLEVESSDVHGETASSAKDEARQEGTAPHGEQAGDEAVLLRAEMLAEEQAGGEETGTDSPQSETKENLSEGEIPTTGLPVSSKNDSEQVNPDDLLEDVRKSLLEEEAQEQREPQKWWKRIGKSSRKKKLEEEPAKPLEEINLPALSAMETAAVEAAVPGQAETEEYQDQIDELIDMLDQEEEQVEESPAPVVVEAPVEPEKPVDLEELKKQAFHSRPEEQEKDQLTEVRAVALEGEEDVFVEVEASKPDALGERLSAVENALNPYRRYITFTLAFLGIVLAVIAGLVMYQAYQRSVAANAPTEIPSDLPFPTTVSLPGGWSFTLGKGALKEGKWNPAGAEWLQGTEICRWVSLPYSRQLEAVIRTLNPEDAIELGMSNNDRLTYKVYSIREMSPEEMQKLDSNSPCLLIVLAEPGAEKRWVLTALP